jgi:hypothetical protein
MVHQLVYIQRRFAPCLDYETRSQTEKDRHDFHIRRSVLLRNERLLLFFFSPSIGFLETVPNLNLTAEQRGKPTDARALGV